MFGDALKEVERLSDTSIMYFILQILDNDDMESSKRRSIFHIACIYSKVLHETIDHRKLFLCYFPPGQLTKF